MKRIALAVALLLAGGLGAAALAQSPAAAPDPAEAQKARDVERLLRVTRAGEVGVQFVDDLLPLIQQMFELQLAGLPEAEREKAKRIMEEEVRREFTADKMVVALGPVYARHFTAEDVKTLLAFWESPLGMKFTSLQPQLLREAGEIGQGMGVTVLGRITARLLNEGILTPSTEPPPPPKQHPARRPHN
jgi:hypothetical protein